MLIIEDLLSTVYGDETVDELPPALTKWLAGWEEAMKLRGVDIRAATKYESFLKQSGMFTEVHADKLDVFVSGQTNGECSMLSVLQPSYAELPRPSSETTRNRAPAHYHSNMRPRGPESIRRRSYGVYGASCSTSDE